MSPSDRLAHLRRQRLLIQEHLAWLEREIAEAECAAPSAARRQGEPADLAVGPGPAPVQPVTSVAEAAQPSLGADAPDELNTTADAIMSEYHVAPVDVRSDVRKGCLLYFAGALVLLGAAVTILYFALRH